MSSEVRTDCYFCHEKLVVGISETVVHGYPKRSYVIKHEPRLKCPKCRDMFPDEPYQYEKTEAFIKFLESISLEKAEIEYKDMIRYVDNVLKPDFDL